MKKGYRSDARSLVRRGYVPRVALVTVAILVAAWVAPRAGAQVNSMVDAGVGGTAAGGSVAEGRIVAAQLEYQASRVQAYHEAVARARLRLTALPSGGYVLTFDLACDASQPCHERCFPGTGSRKNGRVTVKWYVNEATSAGGASRSIRLLPLP